MLPRLELRAFVDRGLVKPPVFVQTIFGILGGIGADFHALAYMKQTADRLFGNDYIWSVLAAGRAQIPMTTQAAIMGANVRVGLEDNLWMGPGELAPSNAALVTKSRSILEQLGLTTATPDEAHTATQVGQQPRPIGARSRRTHNEAHPGDRT